jgi:AcrR family transcriptional regulator
MTGIGLRERKKQQTRKLIYETAARLFAERGFDSVTVAEIAREADVSEVTVFNYFPTKDDLFFGGMEFFEDTLIEAVRSRASEVSVLAAFREPVLDGLARLETDETARLIAKSAALINASPSLQVRERELVARYTEVLARLIADEGGAEADDVEAVGVATALMGSQRALVAYVRARVLAGESGPALVEQARSQATRVFARLDRGLASYAPGRG